MGWWVWDSNPSGGKIFQTPPDWPQGPPSLLYNGYQVSFPEVKWVGRGNEHPHLLLTLRLSIGRATPVPPLCACLACYETIFYFFCYSALPHFTLFPIFLHSSFHPGQITIKTMSNFNTLRTGDADLRFQHGETRYICKFSLLPLHKGERSQRYHTLKHY
jgi:hypothetical protein